MVRLAAALRFVLYGALRCHGPGLRDGHRPDPDAETADAMRRLAEAFVKGAAEEGDPFGWESAEASRLDGVCDVFLANDPPSSHRPA